MKVLALGTYPIRQPIHGGQRRTSQIGRHYQAHGITYRHACVYSASHYSGPAVGRDDYPYSSIGGIYGDTPFIEDMGSGAFAATQDGPYAHFRDLVETYQPDVIQIEQPFMWPLARRLRAEGRTKAKLLYSSHNLEAPLKRDILENAGVERARVALVEDMVQEIETELAEQSDLLVAVSEGEAEAYRRINPALETLVIRNGAEQPQGEKRPKDGARMSAGDYFFFVGSAYPPNIDGYTRFVLGGGLYGFPPKKLFAICGGASDGIYASHAYLPHGEGYGDRVHFFPKPSDDELAWLRSQAKTVLLPIAKGGGSNLKTAEALSSGKWVVTTSMALRSFEDFLSEPGVLVADTPHAFQQAMLDALYGPPLSLTRAQTHKREALFWDRLLDEGGLAERVKALAPGTVRPARRRVVRGAANEAAS